MAKDLILDILINASYIAVDFLMFNHFIHNRKGLIQISIAKYKAKNIQKLTTATIQTGTKC